jgi:hypothetical protein
MYIKEAKTAISRNGFAIETVPLKRPGLVPMVIDGCMSN